MEVSCGLARVRGRWAPRRGDPRLSSPDASRLAFSLDLDGPQNVFVAEVTTTPSFAASVPRVLFERSDVHRDSTGLLFGAPFDVSRDAQRIIMNVIAGEAVSQPINVVVDWMAELER